MKSYYSDYIAHCVRLYLKLSGTAQPLNLSSSAMADYTACEEVFNTLNAADRLFYAGIYSQQSMKDAIKALSESTGVKETTIWAKVKGFEREVAQHRGLV